MFPDKLHVSSFPVRFPHYWLCNNSSIVSPLKLCWVKGACVFTCNLPSELLAEWLFFVFFTCHCINTGVERTSTVMSQHTKWTLEKKILPTFLPGFDLTTFWSQVWRSYQQALPEPSIILMKISLSQVSVQTVTWDLTWHSGTKYRWR